MICALTLKPGPNISNIRAESRAVTQAISRDLYERGASAIKFYSNHDSKPCFALLEGRALLHSTQNQISLLADVPELQQVCTEYSLTLETHITHRSVKR